MSISLNDLTLAQMIMVSQGLGHDIDRKRAERAHVAKKIAERIAAGESEHDSGAPQQPIEEVAPSMGDAAAPGAMITVNTSHTGA